MMNGGGPGPGRSKEPVERVMDLFVHTPIGLAVMAWKRAPGLVGSVPGLVGQALAKGCAQLAEAEGKLSEEVRKARMIGQVAVTFGGRQVRKEVDARLADVVRTAEGVANFIAGTTATATPEAPVGGRSNGAAARPTTSPAAAPDGPVTSSVTETAPASPPPEAPVRRAPARKAPATKPARATPARKRTKPQPASAADLPIREYDGLSASQVVSRLTGLTPGELRAVRGYEEASRGRRTILLAIDRLLG